MRQAQYQVLEVALKSEQLCNCRNAFMVWYGMVLVFCTTEVADSVLQKTDPIGFYMMKLQPVVVDNAQSCMCQLSLIANWM